MKLPFEAPAEFSSMTKRDFLRAAGAAAVTWSLSSPSFAQAQGPYDLIVVGGGNAGLPTAIFAAARGARVLIVEAASAVGGTLFMSSGQMSAAGTKLQKAKGIADTPQSHYDDVMRISRGTADPALVKLAVENAAPAFDWLMDHGFQVREGHPETGTTHDPYTNARYAWGPEGGRSILKVLNEQLQPHLANGRVTALTQTEVVELVQDRRGAITGVIAKGADGKRVQIDGRYTALTCGGYTYNPEMYEKLEGFKLYTRMTYPYSKGAGITLGTSVGGYVRGADKHTPLFGAVLMDSNYPTGARAMVRHFPPDRPPFEIYVNSDGQRFLREDIPSHDAHEQAIRAQKDERCWVVFDDAILKAAPPLVRGGMSGRWGPQDTLKAFENKTPMFFRAHTIEELAKQAGVNAAGLAKAIADYNSGQASGKDKYGRQHMPLPIAKPPFYAIQLQSWTLVSYGGLGVDARLQATKRDGSPIPNLYVAGELLGMGQLMGQAVPGGMSVTPALALGRLLGHQILKF